MTDYKLYDVVTLERWDATEPHSKRFGEGKIIKLTKGRSQSGIVADIQNRSGRVLRGMDIAWLSLVSDGSADRAE